MILSVNRGLWGEVTASLRSLRVAYDTNEIHLFCYFTPGMSEDDQEAMQVVGSWVTADFPDYRVFAHCIASDPGQPAPNDAGAQTVFLRKEHAG